MPTPSFTGLWNNYPTEASPCDGPWSNQCSIRMSVTLNAERSITINKNTYSEPKCAHGHARGAESLANWLWKHHLGRPKIFMDGAEAKANKKAIRTSFSWLRCVLLGWPIFLYPSMAIFFSSKSRKSLAGISRIFLKLLFLF